MLWTLVNVLFNRDPGDLPHVRCARCGHITNPIETPMLTRSSFTVSRGILLDGYQMPQEWKCPSCGRDGPSEAGELLSNDTPVRCHTFVCRYVWKAPGMAVVVTCPRCYTRQPGPAG